YGAHPVPLTQPNVLGVLSLILWSLVVVVMVKYHIYVLRFDNRGEGGILALMGLVGMDKSRRAAVRSTLIVLGVFGAALLSVARGPLFHDQRHAGISRARRGLPRHHRRRGALRRSRTFRRATDPDRLVQHRRTIARPPLLRPGRAADPQSRRRAQSVLSARA